MIGSTSGLFIFVLLVYVSLAKSMSGSMDQSEKDNITRPIIATTEKTAQGI